MCAYFHLRAEGNMRVCVICGRQIDRRIDSETGRQCALSTPAFLSWSFSHIPHLLLLPLSPSLFHPLHSHPLPSRPLSFISPSTHRYNNTHRLLKDEVIEYLDNVIQMMSYFTYYSTGNKCNTHGTHRSTHTARTDQHTRHAQINTHGTHRSTHTARTDKHTHTTTRHDTHNTTPHTQHTAQLELRHTT
jgi:hypothetical protein